MKLSGKLTTFNYVNGGRIPKHLQCDDELGQLSKRYTPGQIKKMWDCVKPRLTGIQGKIIITGTSKHRK